MGQMVIGGLSVFFSDEDSELIGRYNWHTYRSKHNRTHYAATKITGPNGVRYTLFMHRLVMGLKKGDGLYTDHIDRNGLNNYRTNLRIVTQSDNIGNSSKRRGPGSSQYKGVYFKKTPELLSPWVASITHKGKRTFRYYRTELEAARSYNEMAIELFGPCARLNVIEPK